MNLHGNPSKVVVLALFLASLPGCTRNSSKNLFAKDLEALCHIQQSFVESKRLMKKVHPEELLQERNLRMQRELKVPALLALFVAGSQAAAPSQETVESVAKENGFKQWSCPALKTDH